MFRVLPILALTAGLLAAQDAATLRGRVTDPQGAAVAGAEVRLHRQDTGAVLRTSTSNGGDYRFERLAAGLFLLEVEKEHFRGATTAVRIDKTGATADVALALAGVSQSVVVTAGGAPQQLDEISKAVTLITGADIRDRNEYSLSEILRNTPGVLITNGGGPGQNTSIRLRGLRPDAAAVLVDGLRFRDASALQSDASSFVPALHFIGADRVEVLRGSGSSLYGTNAVGGVVNVVTAEGGGPFFGDVQAEAGNLGLHRGRGHIGGGAFGDRLKYTAGFLHLNITRGVDGNDAYRNTGGQGFARYDLTSRASISARLWASDDFVQLNVSPSTSGVPAVNYPADGFVRAIPLSPAGVDALNGGGVPAWGAATYVPGRDDPDSRKSSRFYTAAFTFRHAIAPRASWQASYQRVHTGRVFLNGPAGGGFQPAADNYSRYVGDVDTADVRAIAQPSPWLSLTGGYEFERESYFDRQVNNLPPPRLVEVETRIQQDAHSAYGAAQLGLAGRRLQISFSGRAQAFRLSRPRFITNGAANNYAQVRLEAPPRALTGDAAVAYLIPRSGTKLRAHLGNAYRAAALYERFGGGFSANPATGIVGFTAYGDPRLSPDRYNSVDAGVDQYLFASRLRLSATAFYSRVISVTAFDFSGAIRPVTDPYNRTSGYINGSGGISRGVEMAFESRPMRGLTLNGSYTHTNADLDRDLTVAGFYRVFGQPAHTATLVATRQWTRRFDTTFDLFRSSGYFISFFAVSRSRAFAFPGYTKADLAASYRVWESEKKVARLYGKVDNLFNARYYQNGWLASRASFVIGVGYGF